MAYQHGCPKYFQLSWGEQVALPAHVTLTAEYTNSHYGTSSIGQNTACYGCRYDSLNIGINSFPGAPFSGTDVSEEQVFANGVVDNGWATYRPLSAIVTN